MPLCVVRCALCVSSIQAHYLDVKLLYEKFLLDSSIYFAQKKYPHAQKILICSFT